MGLVMNDQGIAPDKAGVKGPDTPAVSITGEEKFAPDHVHSPDYQGWPHRIKAPLPVVGQFTPQGADRQEITVPVGYGAQSLQGGCRLMQWGRVVSESLFQLFAEFIGHLAGLVDDGPAVHHVDKTTWNLGLLIFCRKREKPDWDHRSLAETGRKITRGGNHSLAKVFIETALPGERVFPCDRLKKKGKTGFVHNPSLGASRKEGKPSSWASRIW